MKTGGKLVIQENKVYSETVFAIANSVLHCTVKLCPVYVLFMSIESILTTYFKGTFY